VSLGIVSSEAALVMLICHSSRGWFLVLMKHYLFFFASNLVLCVDLAGSALNKGMPLDVPWTREDRGKECRFFVLTIRKQNSPGSSLVMCSRTSGNEGCMSQKMACVCLLTFRGG